MEFLPFAVELLSKQLVKHREWTLADLQRKLAQSRLDALKWGGGTTHEIGIRASFLLSYRGLAAEERKFFDTLGAFGGEDFDIAASAAIAQVERAAAEKMLEHLLDLSMAQAGRSAGRYRLHTLMRDFARELCGENLHDAESRMATYYCEHLIETVNDAKSKSDEVIRNFLDIELRNYQFAIDWLIVNLTRERYPLVRDAIDSLDYHLELRGYWQERIANLESALKAANKFGDEFAVARILRRLALALIDIGEWNRAESSLRDAIAKSELLDDFEGLGLAYSDLGNLYGSRGDWRHAIANNELAVTYFRKLDDFYGISRAYSGLGIAYDSKGDLDVAIEYYKKALALLDASDSPRDVAQIYGNLGLIYKDKGNLEKALDYHQKDLAVMQRIGDVSGMAQAKANLANVYRHMGNLEKSIELFEESSEAFEKLNAPQDVASNLINLGGIYADEGAIEKGMQAFERALSIALRLGDELTTAGAYMNIGLLYESIGDLRIAEDWIEKSVALKERLGAPNATEDREYLEALKQKLAPPAEPAE